MMSSNVDGRSWRPQDGCETESPSSHNARHRQQNEPNGARNESIWTPGGGAAHGLLRSSWNAKLENAMPQSPDSAAAREARWSCWSKPRGTAGLRTRGGSRRIR
jgi:hypothetical protein